MFYTSFVQVVSLKLLCKFYKLEQKQLQLHIYTKHINQQRRLLILAMHLSCILVIGCKKRDRSKLPKLLIIVQPWVSELDRYPSCKSESKLDSNFLLGLQNARQPKRPNSRSNKQQQSVDCSDKRKSDRIATIFFHCAAGVREGASRSQ